MIFGFGGGHIGFKKNANGQYFAHPLKNIFLGLYKLESIDKKSLYSNSTLCVISSWLSWVRCHCSTCSLRYACKRFEQPAQVPRKFGLAASQAHRKCYKSAMSLNNLPLVIIDRNAHDTFPKLESVRTLLKIIRLGNRKACPVIMCPNSHEKVD